MTATTHPRRSPAEPATGLTTGPDGFVAFLTDLGALLGRDLSRSTPTTRLTEDLGFDSCDRLELLGLFDARGMELPEELVLTLATLGDVQHYLDRITPLASPSANVLEGATVALRPVHPEDEPYLFDLFTRGDHLVRFRLRGVTPAPESFHRFLWERVLAQFVVVTADGHRVGLVSCFDADLRNRHAHLAVAAEPEVAASGLGAEATARFVSYLFGEFDLRKLYAETLEPNYQQFASGAGRLFDVEGRLVEHEYLGGRYVDALLLAVRRDQWRTHHERLFGLPAGF